METQVLLPTAAEVRGLLGSLLGRDVTLRVTAQPAATEPSDLVGRFVDDEQRLRAVTLCDLAGAAYLGAALALLPTGLPADSIRSGVLAADLADNVHEVLNVLAVLLNGHEHPHVRFVGMTAATEALPDAIDAAGSSLHRFDITFDVRGYGAGRLALAVV